MKIKLNVQKDGENLIKDRLIKESESKPKKAYFFMGNIKESGFDILEECLIDSKAKKLIVVGIDKKNTTKKMLDTLFNYTKSVYVFNNNEMVEFDSNIALFEYESRAVIYIMNSNVSEGSFVDDIATYTEIEYDLTGSSDSLSYKEYLNTLVSISKLENARKLDKEYIKELFDNGQIFTTKQYNHNVMTIAELLGENMSKEASKKKVDIDNDIEVLNEENETSSKLEAVDLSDIEDFSIDIDIDDSVRREENIAKEVEKKDTKSVKKEKVEAEIEKIEELEDDEISDLEFDENGVLDIESLLFEKSDIKLDKKSIDKKISKEKSDMEEKAVSKKVDLTKITNLIMELPKKPTKGKDISVLKVPNYIKDMIPDFFAITVKSKSVEKSDGVYRESKIKLEIVDVLSGKKYSDSKAKIVAKSGQTYIMFSSDELSLVNYEEGDIVRVIKLTDDTYHIEVVSKSTQEYKIWKKLCTKNFKGSSRSYGVM